MSKATTSSAHPHLNCPFCGKSVADLIAAQLETGPKSAADVTKWLRDTGHMPSLWTVIDIADYMREFFGPFSSDSEVKP